MLITGGFFIWALHEDSGFRVHQTPGTLISFPPTPRLLLHMPLPLQRDKRGRVGGGRKGQRVKQRKERRGVQFHPIWAEDHWLLK